MARNLDSKCKQCRRTGEKLFLKGERCFSSKCAMVKRNYAPGVHGSKGSRKMSNYGEQLKEKQKLIKTYRLLERQFSNYYVKAKKMKGKTGENLLTLLEMRLDNVVYRLNIVKSRDSARQIVNHGHVLVNGKKVDIPSYSLKVGDTVSIKQSSLNKRSFQEKIKKINKKEVPAWLSFTDQKNIQAKITDKPDIDNAKQNVNTAMIVEYYSQ